MENFNMAKINNLAIPGRGPDPIPPSGSAHVTCVVRLVYVTAHLQCKSKSTSVCFHVTSDYSWEVYSVHPKVTIYNQIAIHTYS